VGKKNWFRQINGCRRPGLPSQQITKKDQTKGDTILDGGKVHTLERPPWQIEKATIMRFSFGGVGLCMHWGRGLVGRVKKGTVGKNKKKKGGVQ